SYVRSGRLGHTLVPNSHVLGHGFPDALQTDSVGHLQMSGKVEIASRHVDHPTPSAGSGVQGFLKGRSSVGLAVTFGAEISDRNRFGSSTRQGPEQQNRQGDWANSTATSACDYWYRHAPKNCT